MTLRDDRHDFAQAAAFDAVHASEGEYNRNLMDFWIHCVATHLMTDKVECYEYETARELAKSLIQSTGKFAHLPLEERREKVDKFERERVAQEWSKVTKSKKEVTA